MFVNDTGSLKVNVLYPIIPKRSTELVIGCWKDTIAVDRRSVIAPQFLSSEE
jgi:hypothetical protein